VAFSARVADAMEGLMRSRNAVALVVVILPMFRSVTLF
jgi:hypothetical protein